MGVMWEWAARDKETGRERWFFSDNAPGTEDGMLAHAMTHFRNLDFSDFKCKQAFHHPQKFSRPVPDKYYMFGALDAVKKELEGEMQGRVRPASILETALINRRSSYGSLITQPAQRSSRAAERVQLRQSIIRR